MYIDFNFLTFFNFPEILIANYSIPNQDPMPKQTV